MTRRTRVRITDPDHPYSGREGTVMRKVSSGQRRMWGVRLDHDGPYVELREEQMEEVSDDARA